MSGQLEKGWEQVTVRVSENYHKVHSFLNYKYINEKLGKKIIDNALIYSLDRLVVDGFKYKIIPFKGTREPKGFTLKETTTKKVKYYYNFYSLFYEEKFGKKLFYSEFIELLIYIYCKNYLDDNDKKYLSISWYVEEQ